MPSKDKKQTDRDRKKNKKINSNSNGKYNSKYIRQKVAILENNNNKQTVSNKKIFEEKIQI